MSSLILLKIEATLVAYVSVSPIMTSSRPPKFGESCPMTSSTAWKMGVTTCGLGPAPAELRHRSVLSVKTTVDDGSRAKEEENERWGGRSKLERAARGETPSPL